MAVGLLAPSCAVAAGALAYRLKAAFPYAAVVPCSAALWVVGLACWEARCSLQEVVHLNRFWIKF